MSNDLSKIYIWAKVDDKWGSFSLEELYDMGEMESIKYWLIDKVLSVVGLREEELIAEIEKMDKKGSGDADEQPVEFGFVFGYNKALDDVIALIRKRL